MNDAPRPVEIEPGPLTPQRPSLLLRVAVWTLVPLLVVAALPLLLLIILALYLLALVQGGRVFFFSWNGKQQQSNDVEADIRKPHFLEIEGPKTVPDETTPPAKG